MIVVVVDDPSAPKSITFTVAEASVTAKKKLDLTKLLILMPTTANAKSLTWVSDNPAVATVSKDKVKGVSAGTAKITACYGKDLSTSIVITVKQPGA